MKTLILLLCVLFFIGIQVKIGVRADAPNPIKAMARVFFSDSDYEDEDCSKDDNGCYRSFLSWWVCWSSCKEAVFYDLIAGLFLIFGVIPCLYMILTGGDREVPGESEMTEDEKIRKSIRDCDRETLEKLVYELHKITHDKQAKEKNLKTENK